MQFRRSIEGLPPRTGERDRTGEFRQCAGTLAFPKWRQAGSASSQMARRRRLIPVPLNWEKADERVLAAFCDSATGR